MRFKVPQDVQRADQIIGPLTWKQLIILGAGGAVCYAIYVSLAKKYHMEIWLPPVAIVGGITAALAFLKIHGLTFERWLLAFMEYHLLPKKRIWKKGQAEPFVSYLDRISSEKDKKLEESQNKKEQEKKSKSIKELSKVLDSYGGSKDGVSDTNETELTKMEKKKTLNKLINHEK